MSDHIYVDGRDTDGNVKRVRLDVTNGTKHVFNVGLPVGTLLSQTKAVGASRVRFTFDPPIKACTINVRGAPAAQGEDDVAIVVIIPDGLTEAEGIALADAWLDEANTAPRIVAKVINPDKEIYFNEATASYVDVIGAGSTPSLTVTVGGIS